MGVSLYGRMLLTFSARVFGLTSLFAADSERINGCVELFSYLEGRVDEGA